MKKEMIAAQEQGQYYLVESVKENICVYGVGIQYGKDESCVEDIFTNREECMEFLELLSSYAVEPMHLQDIAEDYIA